MVKIDEGFDYKFYVCNSKGKLVMGFDERDDAVVYAAANHYRVSRKKDVMNRGINPENVNNWTNTYPEKGLV